MVMAVKLYGRERKGKERRKGRPSTILRKISGELLFIII